MNRAPALSPLRRAARRVRLQLARGAFILAYHRICRPELDPWALAVTPEHFAGHLEVLRRMFVPLSLAGLVEALAEGRRLPGRAVVVTFDDGYVDYVQSARPLLEQSGVPAVFFLATGLIGSGGAFWWEELARLLLRPGRLPPRLALAVGGETRDWDLSASTGYDLAKYRQHRLWRAGQPAPGPRQALYMELWSLLCPLPPQEQQAVMAQLRSWAGAVQGPGPERSALTWEEAASLAQGDLLEIGAHTVSHTALGAQPVEVQREEIANSRRQLEAAAGRPVTLFSYPFGGAQDFTPVTARLVREAGFRAACAYMPGRVEPGADRYRLPRLHAPDMDGEGFERWLAGKFYS